MRLLDVEIGQFVEKDPERTVYAILSHTRDTENGEQTYQELKKIQRRYGTRSYVPQSRPGPESGTLSSPEQDRRDGPPPTPPPSQLPRTPSVMTLTPASSGLSTPKIQPDTHASSLPPVDVPSSDDPPAPATSGPSALSPERQSKPPPQSIWDDPELSPKICEACAVARAHGYRYIWIDSYCIDKSSSSELSEAINSMYASYARAAVCYAYLADAPPGDDHQTQGSCFRESWWFRRGWTLQELIAPGSVVFLSKDWASIGSKQALVNLVESVTKINYQPLLHLEPLHKFSVAQRLFWVANREMTRKEDRAYSLLGIFDIHMPTLYGEATARSDGCRSRSCSVSLTRASSRGERFTWAPISPGTLTSLTSQQLFTLHNGNLVGLLLRHFLTPSGGAEASVLTVMIPSATSSSQPLIAMR